MMRADWELIANWIKPNTRVLDLGCGEGELLKYLREVRNVSGLGLEIDDDNIARCVGNGVDVIQADLEGRWHDYFSAQSFDYVLMTQTLQAVRNPDRVLDEMLRIAKETIITFYNMGYWKNRMQLFRGRMPVTTVLPAQWYQTENIHLCTISDFEALCDKKKIHCKERAGVNHSYEISSATRLLPNLMSEVALYLLTHNR